MPKKSFSMITDGQCNAINLTTTVKVANKVYIFLSSLNSKHPKHIDINACNIVRECKKKLMITVRWPMARNLSRKCS